MENQITKTTTTIVCIVGVLLIISLLITPFIVIPQYNVWRSGLSGKAELAKAEWNRQVVIKEANAKRESATALAEAEVIRAEGVAKANKIIGDSLNGNEAYLHYLWINELAAAGHVIYVPTEANLPILEAGRLNVE